MKELLQPCIDAKSAVHKHYLGQAMPDAVYQLFALVRDGVIPALAQQEQPAQEPVSTDVMPHGQYGVILADPPWDYGSKAPTERMRPCVAAGAHPASANHYYQTMKMRDIKALPVSSFSAESSVLFLWATTPLLPDAIDTMKAWGWKYKTAITWHKTNRDCMGYWFRVCTEHLLVGVRGKPKAFRSMQRTLLESPRGKHSEKPESSYELIEAVTTGPRLELFARRKRGDWHTWGNEVPCDVSMGHNA